MQWESVYVFISSTFNDMHAERDLLVKRVFPELRRWCAERKLKLMDIDLRWGVSAADAQENKRVVEVCMRNIDRCRPFFLCFLGQRRGWIPGPEDINPDTLAAFPGLKRYLGKSSVTELEILHALLQPMDGKSPPVSHARFYFRDPGYLKAIKSPAHKNLFAPKAGLFSAADKDLEQFKKNLRPQFPVVDYRAAWNPERPSPELPGELSLGRLDTFRVGEDSLEADVLRWLQQEIAAQYPEHLQCVAPDGSLEQELERQDTQLFQARDGYIPRPSEEQALAALLDAPDHRPLVLLAEAGCGKTSLLAQTICQQRQSRPVYYRFVGTTPQSFHLDRLSHSLVHQWIGDGLLDEKAASYTREELLLVFPNLLWEAASRRPFLLVLDGMDQLLGESDWQHWLPPELPEDCDVLLSLREDSCPLPEGLRVHHLGLMNDQQDKIQMVRCYMSGFLKDVDDEQLARIVSMAGSSNPLYMKIVLNELRQHGSFDTLYEMLVRDYGSTPSEAFRQVLLRLKEEFQQNPNLYTVFFGCLCLAQTGLDSCLFYGAARCLPGDPPDERDFSDQVYGLARQLEPFLVLDGDRVSLRYDSLRRAIAELYTPASMKSFHALLAGAYRYKAGLGQDKPNCLLQLLYHIGRAHEDSAAAFFKDTGSLLLTLRSCGSRPLADCCRYLSEQRRFPAFQALARVLTQVGARLDAHPDTLFMELRRFGDREDPLIHAILEREARHPELRYLEPLTPPGAATRVLQEYTLPDDTEYAACTGGYLLIHQKKLLKVVEQQSLKTVNVMHLEEMFQSRTVYNRRFVTAGDGLVYLSRWEHNRLLGWQCYCVPELRLVEEGCVETDFSTLTQLRVVEGTLYGLFQEHRYREDRSTQSVTTRLVDLQNGQILVCHESQGECACQFPGRVLVLRDEYTGIFQVFETITGRLLHSEKFIGRCDSSRGSPLDGGANLHAACGEYLYLWMFGSAVTDGERRSQRKFAKYEITDQGSLQQLCECGQDVSCSNLQLLDGRYVLAESFGQLVLLDSDLRLLGFLNLGTTVQGFESWSGQCMLNGEDLLTIFLPGKVQTYDLRQLKEALSDQEQDSSTIAHAAWLHDSRYYVFTPHMSCRELGSMALLRELPSYHQYEMRYSPWNLAHLDLFAGTGDRSGLFSLKRLSDMQLLLQMPIPGRESRRLLHACVYRDREDEYQLCLVVAPKEQQRLPFHGKIQPFCRCSLCLNSLRGLAQKEPWEELPLDVDISDQGALPVLPQSVCGEHYGHLVFPNVYKGEHSAALQLFDLESRQFIHCIDYPPEQTLLFHKDILYFDRGFVFLLRNEEGHTLWQLDLKTMKAYRAQQEGVLLHSAPDAGYIFIHDTKNARLACLDLEKHSIDKFIPLAENYRSLQQAVLLQDWLILRQLESERVEVYDYSSGEKLFEQQLETVAEELNGDTASGILCMDACMHTGFWKKRSAGE